MMLAILENENLLGYKTVGTLILVLLYTKLILSSLKLRLIFLMVFLCLDNDDYTPVKLG